MPFWNAFWFLIRFSIFIMTSQSRFSNNLAASVWLANSFCVSSSVSNILKTCSRDKNKRISSTTCSVDYDEARLALLTTT